MTKGGRAQRRPPRLPRQVVGEVGHDAPTASPFPPLGHRGSQQAAAAAAASRPGADALSHAPKHTHAETPPARAAAILDSSSRRNLSVPSWPAHSLLPTPCRHRPPPSWDPQCPHPPSPCRPLRPRPEGGTGHVEMARSTVLPPLAHEMMAGPMGVVYHQALHAPCSRDPLTRSSLPGRKDEREKEACMPVLLLSCAHARVGPWRAWSGGRPCGPRGWRALSLRRPASYCQLMPRGDGREARGGWTRPDLLTRGVRCGAVRLRRGAGGACDGLLVRAHAGRAPRGSDLLENVRLVCYVGCVAEGDRWRRCMETTPLAVGAKAEMWSEDVEVSIGRRR